MHEFTATGPGERFDRRLAALFDMLVRSRSRFALRSLTTLIVSAVLTALAVFCVLQLTHYLLGAYAPSFSFALGLAPTWLLAWRPSPSPEHVALASLAGVLVLVAAPIAAMLLRPAIGSVARAADLRFGTDEGIATALEASSNPAQRSFLVVEALVKSVSDQAKAFEARNLAPFGLPRAALAIPVLAAAAAALLAAPPPALLQDAYFAWRATDAEREDALRTQQDETVANLRAVAAILKVDGDERADPAIQSIARALEQLANRAQGQGAGALGANELATELERLTGRARDAYARAGETINAGRNLSRLVAGLNDKAVNRPRGAVAGATRPAPGEVREEKAPAELAGLLTTREYAGIDDFRDLVKPGTIVGDGRTDRPGGGDGALDGAGAPDGYDDEFFDGPRNAANVADAAARGGRLIGGADGAGAGDFAGVGTQGLFGRNAAGELYRIDGELTLQNPGAGNGRRIRFDLAPETQARDALVNLPLAAAAGWRPAQETEVTRADLPAPSRDIVGRYFDALRVGAGK